MSYRIAMLATAALLVPKTHDAADIDFARDVRPILSDACYTCHGPDEEGRATDWRLDQRESAFDADLFSTGEMRQRLLATDPAIRMPPPESNRTLSDADRQTLVRWLEAGADWPEDDRHWAFRSPSRPPLPNVQGSAWPSNEIDMFVLSRLRREGLQPNSPADRATLLRRVTFDLTGMPPTIEALDAFLADDSKQAYERAVDRLLASKGYGEHMALDWLEAARYADTDGYQNDRLRYMWVWRDWLIQALNQNMPFDQFVLQQMAGDLLPDRNFYTQVATGFHRNHRINSEGGSIPDEWIVEYVADRVETMGTALLGLTLTCSRCHDHKYDPIAQRDFYRLFAFFNNIAEAGLGPNNGNSPPFIPVPKSWPHLSAEEAKFVEPEPVKIKIQQVSVPRPQPGSAKTVMVLHELDQPRDTYLLKRGLYDQPDTSEKLLPGTPPALGAWNDDWPRNRLGLARWLISPENPLTARVAVNRYWQHFFGVGLVQTSENFGVQGELPSHPQLLDWLATEFMAQQWDVKAMHKLIVMSSTYRQSSAGSEQLVAEDPHNRLLARGPRRRLSPFAIRDAALLHSGLLVERLGGPSVKPYMPPGIWKSVSNSKYQQDKGAKLYRRSIYTYWRRTLPPPTMMSFNAAARETCIVRTDVTTTPLQALTLLNNITFVEAARCLAERMLDRTDETPEERIQWAFRLVTSRAAQMDEWQLLSDDLELFVQQFSAAPDRAEQLLSAGEKPRRPELSAAELAAYTLVANTILNLDESISLN